MTTTETETTTQSLKSSTPISSIVKTSSKPSIRTIPFYVSLPCDIEFDMITSTALQSLSIKDNNSNKKMPVKSSDVVGVVGTITLLKSSVMVWIGWSVSGNSAMDDDDKEAISSTENISEIRRRETTTPLPMMGPLAIAMPRTSYNNKKQQQASSQLIGGESEEDQMMGHQMACRLSQKLNCPVVVSCSLSISRNVLSHVAGGSSLTTDELIAQRAAAFAEREIGKIILREKEL